MLQHNNSDSHNEFKTPLTLEWSFGFNNSIPSSVHSLITNDNKIVFYPSAHTGVIHDFGYNAQKLLQGHCNSITSTLCSPDKTQRWLVTADAGPNSVTIIWDRRSAIPVKTIFDPHNSYGTIAMDISKDCKYLATLGADSPQTLCIWEWATDNDSPIVHYEFNPKADDIQTFIRINPHDPFEILTNGATSVSFFGWSQAGIQRFQPQVNKQDSRRSTTFSQSCFIPTTTQAVSATKEGDVVVWDCFDIGNITVKKQKENKTAIKRINHLHSHAINVIIPFQDKCILTGDDDGHIRIYDVQFKLIAFLEKLKSGPISSISFHHGHCESIFDEIYVPDLIVSTKTGKILQIQRRSKSPTISTLLQTQFSPVKALAAHPKLSHCIIGDDSAFLQVWNYGTRSVETSRQFPADMGMITSAIYSHEGAQIAVGFETGHIVVLGSDILNADPVAKFELSQSKIIHLSFSSDDRYLAFADSNYAVGLFQQTTSGWTVIGKFRSHSKTISAILFNPIGSSPSETRLVSVSIDKTVVEYDISSSSIESGLKIRHTKKLEQSAEPLACVWIPPLKDETDSVLITGNSEYKLRIYNGSTQVCRKTVVGPTYSGCLNRLMLLPTAGPPYYLAFGTAEKVIGLMKFPLDGNPHKSAGLIAHPGEISSLVHSHDGKYLLTCGHGDFAVNVWSIDTDALEAQVALGGKGMEPFLKMLHTGDNVEEEFREMENLFYFAQIRSEGEDKPTKRKISHIVKITEVPNILRSYGYYPTEEDVANILNEIKLTTLSSIDKDQDTISFDDLIKIYLNRRPVYPFSESEISEALNIAHLATRDVAENSGNNTLTMERLLMFLQSYGEPIDKLQFEEYLRLLKTHEKGQRSSGMFGKEKFDLKMDEEVTTQGFVEDILGFKVLGV